MINLGSSNSELLICLSSTDKDFAQDRDVILALLAARWEMLHTPLHDVGYLLNPLNLLNQPWTDVRVMAGFRELLDKWEKLVKIDDCDSALTTRDRACAGTKLCDSSNIAHAREINNCPSAKCQVLN